MTSSTPLALTAPRTAIRVRDLIQVAFGAVLIAGLGQVVSPLPFTPVPLSLGTFAALSVGVAFGPLRGMLSAAVVLVAGIAGAPVFAGGGSGWATPTLGYVAGYVLAAASAGFLVKKFGPSLAGTAGAAGIGTLMIYLCGLPVLMAHLHVGLAEAARLGLWPFLPGDALKVLAAAALAPGLVALSRNEMSGTPHVD